MRVRIGPGWLTTSSPRILQRLELQNYAVHESIAFTQAGLLTRPLASRTQDQRLLLMGASTKISASSSCFHGASQKNDRIREKLTASYSKSQQCYS